MAEQRSRGRARRIWLGAWSGAWAPWLLLLSVLFALQLKTWWTPTRDGAAYLSIARNLAAGELAQQGSGHVTYPPGYPALIAPTFWAADRPFFLIALLHLGFMVLASVGIHRWLRLYVGRSAPLLTALAVVNASLWSFYRSTLSETAFLAALVWAALLLDAGLRDPSRRRAWIGGVVLAAVAVLLRSAAVTLAGGVALAWFLAPRRGATDRRRAFSRALVAGVVVVVAFGLLLAVDRLTGARAGTETGGYLYLVDRPGLSLPAQLAEAVRLRTAEMGRLLLPGMHKAYARSGEWLHPATLLYLLLAAGTAWGWWRVARRRCDVLLATLPCYVALYVVWPFDQGTRYLAPMLPVLVLALWGLLAGRRLRRWRRPVLAFLLVAHLGVALGGWGRDLRLGRYDELWPQVDGVASHIPAAERDRVATVGLGLEPTVMLQVALDRPVAQRRPGADLSDALWLLTPPGAEPAGFETREALDAWWLHRRK